MNADIAPTAGSRLAAREPVAIIGMGALFAKARNLAEYWTNILGKEDCISDVPKQYWDVVDYYDPDIHAEDRTYSKRAGVIPEVDFDPLEFGIPPQILEAISVSQLLSLVVAKETFVDAGYLGKNSRKLDRTRTGVILGASIGGTAFPLSSRIGEPAALRKILAASGASEAFIEKVIRKFRDTHVEWQEDSFPGFLANIVSGRICNRFDLGGTNLTVDAACASSLAAVKMAINELQQGDVDAVLTGGVNVDCSPFSFMCFSKTPALSKRNESRPYDSASDGMVIGDGIGMLLLKRLKDARRDNDRVYAVISGIGSSSDGKAKSIYAPNADGQVQAIRRAYAQAGCVASDVGLIEGHGTGTVAGDICEVTALKRVYDECGAPRQTVALGSVKSQIGHTRMAAGTAGLIKVALSLYHKVIPPMINVNEPNPTLGLAESPFYLPLEARPWLTVAADVKRRGAVSSFGFGGANYHAVLEECDSAKPSDGDQFLDPEVIVIAAETVSKLRDRCSGLLQDLSDAKSDANQGARFAHLLSLVRDQTFPSEFPRVGFAARSLEDVRTLLRDAVRLLSSETVPDRAKLPSGVHFRTSGLLPKEKVVAVFSGQGSQYPLMGVNLAQRFEPVASSLGKMDAALRRMGQPSVSPLVYPRRALSVQELKHTARSLSATEVAQPAIGAFSHGLYNLLRRSGFRADFHLGHSFGELTALWAAECMDDDAYFDLVVARGRAMSNAHAAGGGGAMLAVHMDETKLRATLASHPSLIIANYNSPSQNVVSGAPEAIQSLRDQLVKDGVKCSELPVSNAFHTVHMADAMRAFSDALAPVHLSKPKVPVISNLAFREYTDDPEAMKDLLTRQIVSPVHFRQCVENLASAGATVFVEFGPRKILSDLVDSILAERPHDCVPLNPVADGDDRFMLAQAVARLRVLGLDISLPESRARTIGRKKGMSVALSGVEYISEAKAKAIAAQFVTDPTLGNSGGSTTQRLDTDARVVADPGVGNNGESTTHERDTDTRAHDGVPPVYAPEELAPPGACETLLRNQGANSEVQRQFLQGQARQLDLVKTLVGEQLRLASGTAREAGEQAMFDQLSRTIERLNTNNEQCIQVHSLYLEHQLRAIGNGAAAVPGMALSVVPTVPQERLPVPAPDLVAQAKTAASTISTGEATAASLHSIAGSTQAAALVRAGAPCCDNRAAELILQIVSEKTGYPVEMLDLDMGLESDLGIDSIKRIEIFSRLQKAFGGGKYDAAGATTEALAALKTLREIIEFVDGLGVDRSAAPPVSAVPEESKLHVTHSENRAADLIMQIVSEKTGYPVEMLDLDMGLESDLGIDSIKRIEIFSKLQKALGGGKYDAAAAKTEALAALKTLREIIGFVDGLQLDRNEVSPVAAGPTVTGVDSSPGEVRQAILSVVSDKTGYPSELLDLDMDLESDLGIDSIKRIEIFSKLQKSAALCPSDGGASAMETLSSLRTLRQVVDYVTSTARPAQVRESVDGTTTGSPSVHFEQEAVGPESKAPIKKYVPGIATLGEPQLLEREELNAEGKWLIISDGTGLPTELRKSLSESGIGCVCLNPFASQSSGAPSTFGLKSLSEDGVSVVMDEIYRQHGAIRGLVYVHPFSVAGETSCLIDDREIDLIKALFLVVKALKRQLTTTASGKRNAVIFVTQYDGYLGTAKERLYPVVSGGLYGLLKSLHWEWPDVFCRVVDVSPDLESHQAARLVMNELHDRDRSLTEIGIKRDGERVSLVLSEKSESRASGHETAPDQDSLFVVSGGGRGITSDCVVGLAEKYKSNFVLVGRTTMEEEEWSKGCRDEEKLRTRIVETLATRNERVTPVKVGNMLKSIKAKRRILDTLTRIQMAGGKARYIAADITDASSVKNALAEIGVTEGNITGIVHGAGNLSDKLIENKAAKDLDSVFDTKVKGLRTLVGCTDPSKLQHLVVFSSVAGFFGNAGQTDYAAANEVFNKFVYNYNKACPRCNTISMNWGPWDSGMVTDELKEIYRKRNVDIIDSDRGVEHLCTEMSEFHDEHHQVIVGGATLALSAYEGGAK